MSKRDLLFSAVLVICLPLAAVASNDACCLVRGDVDHGGGTDPVNVADLSYLVDYLFLGGQSPPCVTEADVDAGGGDSPVNVADLSRLVNCLFQSGPPPVPCNVPGIDLEQVTLPFGGMIYLDSLDLELTFESVADFRCPLLVSCFWEGAAEVGLRVVHSADTHHVVLPIMGGLVGTIPDNGVSRIPVEVLGFRLTLIQLDPYPLHPDSVIADSAYVATFLVEPVSYDPPVDGEVFFVTSAWARNSGDAYQLDSIGIDGTQLQFGVTYSGGCRTHFFNLYMSPTSFSGSNPREATLYLRHFDDGDMCEALITNDVSFDLQPLLDRYVDTYGQLEPIQLNVSGFSVTFVP